MLVPVLRRVRLAQFLKADTIKISTKTVIFEQYEPNEYRPYFAIDARIEKENYKKNKPKKFPKIRI